MPAKKKPQKRRNPSTSLERQILCYLHPKYFQLFIAYAHSNSWGKSEANDFLIRKFFDSLSGHELYKLQTVWEEMTPEERKYPRRISEQDGD